MSGTKPLLLAVLIDADNISPKWADAIFTEIASLGEASVRRIYGDFTGQKLKGWKEKFAPLALIPHLQVAHTIGKNSSDIALVIDGMDLLHSKRVDGFCLVSSDSDFTRLASRIREQGLPVYGIGQKKTPEAFRMACKRFIFVENLLEAEKPAAVDTSKTMESIGQEVKKEPPSKAVPLILAAMKNIPSEDDWYTLSSIGSQLLAKTPDFDYRTYASSKLSDLLEATGQFEIDRSSLPARVRRKPSGAKK
ncbi:MAG: NYN domain-containing protein [Paracoccaceae bacterium]